MNRTTMYLFPSVCMLLAACGAPAAEPATPTAAQANATPPSDTATPASPDPDARASAPTPAAPAPAASASPGPKDVAGANFVQSNYHGAKDLYFNDIACKAAPDALKRLNDMGGLAGLGAVASGFDAKEIDVKKCVPAKAKPRVSWTAAGGKMTKVKGTDADAKINKCIEATLEGAATKLPDATCATTVWHD
jgi:hypothetical protein